MRFRRNLLGWLAASAVVATATTLEEASFSENRTSGETIAELSGEYSERVQEALEAAGANSAELERAIRHFKDDPRKLEAMCFIVGDTHRRLSQVFPNNEWRSDLAQGGAQEIIDATIIDADYLIDNVNLAFEAVENFSWTRELYENDKDRFFAQVLPYRLGTGLLSVLDEEGTHWRKLFLDEEAFNTFKQKHGLETDYNDIRARLDEFNTRYEGVEDSEEKALILREAIRFIDVDFFENEGCRYFPRGPQELSLNTFFTKGKGKDEDRRGGRCTDSDNALRMGLMSAGIPTSATRFIAWPHGDSNHQVVTVYLGDERFDFSAMVCRNRTLETLFIEGPYVPAKAYEEDWGNWEESSSTAISLKPGEEMPWYPDFYLRTRSMIDVTDRYGPVSDVGFNGLDSSKLVYLGVVNNNSDIDEFGIATVAVERTAEDGSVVFGNVGHGRDTLYFSYYYDRTDSSGDLEARLIAPPFILTKEGVREPVGDETNAEDYSFTVMGEGDQPLITAGNSYTLLVFDARDDAGEFSRAGWREKRDLEASPKGTAEVAGIQESCLYIFRDEGGRFSRPFTYSETEGLEIY